MSTPPVFFDRTKMKGSKTQIRSEPPNQLDYSVAFYYIGASYTAGPVAIGLTYADAEGFKGRPDVATGLPSTYASSYKTYGGGVAYTIAPA